VIQASEGQGAVVAVAAVDVLEGNLEHRRTMAGQGPTPQPAAVAALVDGDYLIELVLGGSGGGGVREGGILDGPGFEPDAGALLEVHGGGKRKAGGFHLFYWSAGRVFVANRRREMVGKSPHP
jgi:hypothetical protein